MSTHDAELSDIYVDENGKLWRCIMTCSEPTVTFEAVEGYLPTPLGVINQMMAAQNVPMYPLQPSLIHPRKSGGISGAMWQGWKRVYRPEPKKPL
jgi:hypothetical protein